MTRGSYTFRENVPECEHDTSYRSCLCALLLLLCICLITVIAGMIWTYRIVIEKIHDPKLDRSATSSDQKYVYEEIAPTNHEIITRTTTTLLARTSRKDTFQSNTPFAATTSYFKETSTSTPKQIPPETENTTLFENYTFKDDNISNDYNETRTSSVLIEETSYKYETEGETVFETTESLGNTLAIDDTITTDAETSGEVQTTSSPDETDHESETEDYSRVTYGTEREFRTIKSSLAINEIVSEAQTTISSLMTNDVQSINEVQTTKSSLGTNEVQNTSELQTSTSLPVRNTELFTKLDTIRTNSGSSEINNTMLLRISTVDDRIIFNQSSFENQQLLSTTKKVSALTTEYENETHTTKDAPQKSTAASLPPTTTPPTTTPCIPVVNPAMTTALVTKAEPVCFTTGCKSTASRMLSLMDHSADACEDFYQFACGGLRENSADSNVWTAIAEELDKIDETSSLLYLQKYAAFYKSCVEHEYIFEYENRLKRIKELVNEVGEIFVIPEADSAVDITELFAKLVLRSSLPFMDVYIEEEKQNSTFVFQLTLPGKSFAFSGTGRWSAGSDGQRRCLNVIRGQLHGRNLDLGKIHDVYLNCLRNYSIYFNSIENVVRALGVFSQLHAYNQTQRIQELRFTIEWNILDLITFDSLNVKKSLVYKKYKVLKISDLQKNYPLLQWKKFFELLSGRNIDDNLSVHVYCIEYFKNLFQELRSTPKRKLKNALIAIYARELFENLVVTQTGNDREEYCLKLSSYLFPDVSSLLYSKTWFPKSKEVTEKFFAKVFLELKHNFSRTLNSVDWLDDTTKTAVLLKVQNLNVAFAKADDNYNNKTYMEEKYSNLNVTSADFIGNFVQTDILRKKALYSLEGNKFSSNLVWGPLITTYEMKPFTVYSKKLTIFPPAVLRKYDVSLPSYLTKAQVGMALAREIGQHFDSVGRHYGLKLKGAQNSTYTAMETFMKNVLLKELTRTLGKRTLRLKIDPELSIKDRIAENTGFRLVSEHLENLDQEPLLPFIMKTFSREKIFFIAVAQEYCTEIDPYKYMKDAFESETLPAPMRVENIVSNSEIFSATFGCPEGSKMNDNPAKSQFPYLTKSEDYAYYENENYKDSL
ncbi:endothelin-converting enzyme homolog [Agrilus planipennis]|uniref:Endothelin-converting enzyme homolog n=1 Tax=Agrilus planipennis TaxID=224129 RepID=A0A1W4WHB2_AGRPL|nr:endothelin-converting enzyme homolog [Agrilus planipennis]